MAHDIAAVRSAPLHYSTLKHMARSPAHYLHAATTDFVPTAGMRLGTLVHRAVLGAVEDDWGHPIVMYDGERKGGVWRDFKLAHPGDEIFTTSELEDAEPIARAVLADPVAAPLLLEGERERHIAWKIGDRAVSSRPDVRHASRIVDLKTTTDASIRTFARQAVRMLYHAQLSFYLDADNAIGGTATEAYLVVVEVEPPYGVTCMRVSDALLDVGRRCVASWLETLRLCEAADQWPGYAQAVVDLDMPSWMQEEDE